MAFTATYIDPINGSRPGCYVQVGNVQFGGDGSTMHITAEVYGSPTHIVGRAPAAVLPPLDRPIFGVPYDPTGGVPMAQAEAALRAMSDRFTDVSDV